MKKLTTILLFTILIITAPAQQEYHKQAFNAPGQNTVYFNQPLKSGTPTIKLDSVVTTRYHTNLTGPFTTPVKEIYEYDSNLRLSQITEKTWHQSKKVFGITGKKAFFYNTEGMVDSIYFKMDGLINKYSFKYIYDTLGRLETFYRYDIPFGKWFISEKMVYSYNDVGKISEIKYFEGSDGYVGQVATFKFSYNEAGKLTEYKRISSWQDFEMELTKYEWDAENKLISSIREDFLYQSKVKTEFVYNSMGDRIKACFYEATNSGWTLSKSYHEYKYCDFNCADLVGPNIPYVNIYDPFEFKSEKLMSEEIHFNDGAVYEKTVNYYSPVTSNPPDIQPPKKEPSIKLDSVIAMKYSEHLNPPFTTPVKEFYEYDNTYRLTQITLKAWNQSTKEFSIIGKKEFFYNPEGLIGSIVFDMMTAQSLNFSYNYTYDTMGRLIKFTQNFTNADLNLSDLIFTYNDLGKLSEIKNYFETKQYRILNNIFVFSYNNAGELSDFKFVWDDAVAYQTFYEWNSENKLLTESFEDYFWGDKTRTEYTYNSIGDRIKSSYSNWENSELKSSGFDEYFYSDFNSSDLAELQNFAEYFYNPIEFKSTKLISEIAHYVGSTFIGKTEYYYSPVTKGGTTGVNNLNTADVNVYPNPATDQITFTWNQNFDRLNLKLFQFTGACVMDRKISSQENISVKSLPKGMYLYKLLYGDQAVKSGKIIVE